MYLVLISTLQQVPPHLLFSFFWSALLKAVTCSARAKGHTDQYQSYLPTIRTQQQPSLLVVTSLFRYPCSSAGKHGL